jgi:hypothetical protein
MTQRAMKTKQSYAEGSPVARQSYSEITQISNEREGELRRLGLGIQKKRMDSDSKCQ